MPGRKPLPDTPLRLRHRASAAVFKAVRSGQLPPLATLTCVDCGAPATCYDHRDYRKPLDVEPVCKRCNNKRGPGLPLPEETRVPQHAIREKTGKRSGGGRSVNVWGSVEGGSKGGTTDAVAAPAVDDGDDWRPTPYRYVTEVLLEATGRAGPISSGLRRAEFFKRRDPWFFEPEILTWDPRDCL